MQTVTSLMARRENRPNALHLVLSWYERHFVSLPRRTITSLENESRDFRLRRAICKRGLGRIVRRLKEILAEIDTLERGKSVERYCELRVEIGSLRSRGEVLRDNVAFCEIRGPQLRQELRRRKESRE